MPKELSYEQMLERGYKSLPKKTQTAERFEIPKAIVLVQGSKTIIQNFGAIIKQINREEKHVLKFLTKESGSSVNAEEGRAIFNAKLGENQVNAMLNNYINEYVLCHECGKPDTHFIEQMGVKVLKCEACGATSPVKHI